MTELGVLLIVLMMLACPVVMGAMIVMMWRGCGTAGTLSRTPHVVAGVALSEGPLAG